MTKIFFIILNFNGGSDTLACLKSLFAEGKKFKWRRFNILVVDNGSTDGSLEKIKDLVNKRDLKNKVEVVQNNTNLGFAGGVNVGIKKALRGGVQSVMLLNQDAVANKGFLQPLMDNPAEIVAPVIKFKRNKKWVYDFGGKVNWWLGRVEHLEKNSLTSIPKEEIDYVSGCSMMIKKKVFENIGLFDERYFLYFEDVDFCLRAKKAGFKLSVEPKSVIVHKLNEKTRKPFKQHWQMFKSNLTFVKIHLLPYQKIIAYPYLVLLLGKIFIGNLKLSSE